MDETTRKRHPIRGLLAGVALGLGVTLLLLVYAQVPFGEITPWVIIGAAVVIGVVAGMVGPARRKTA